MTRKTNKGGVKIAIDMKKLFRETEEAWASRNLEKLESLHADDCVYEDVARGVVRKGKKEISEYFRGLLVGFPDVKFETKGVFFSNNRVCWEWVMTGTHLGNLESLPATRRTISVRGVTVEEIRGDKKSRVSDYYDEATLLRQLGVIPPAPQA